MDEDLVGRLAEILAEKNIDLNEVLENFQGGASDCSGDIKQENGSSSGVNVESLLKFQKLAGLLSQRGDSKDESLLRALKPYLRDSRKEKIDKYIKMLRVVNLLEKFQDMGGSLDDIL